jgi:ketosteroid isomerase-like protein
LDDWVQALRSRDADAITSRQAPGVVSFDVVNPLQYVGSDETRRRAEEWLSSFQGSVGLEMRELSVTVGDDVAFAHSLNRVSGRMADGQAIGMWLRSTVCLRKIDGQWTVTHQHSSVPFDGESGRASLDLKP